MTPTDWFPLSTVAPEGSEVISNTTGGVPTTGLWVTLEARLRLAVVATTAPSAPPAMTAPRNTVFQRVSLEGGGRTKGGVTRSTSTRRRRASPESHGPGRWVTNRPPNPSALTA